MTTWRRSVAVAWLGPVALALTVTLAPAAPESRHALVIGNGAYQDAPLANAVNDARDMGRVLRQSGFEVVVLEDASLGAMVRALREFGDRMAKGGIGLFYFAGHGLQVKGRNYLVPTARPSSGRGGLPVTRRQRRAREDGQRAQPVELRHPRRLPQ